VQAAAAERYSVGMGTWRSGQRFNPITKARLLRERAAECRVRAEDDGVGSHLREGYLDLARAYEALAYQHEANAAGKDAWAVAQANSYSGPFWRTGSRAY